VSFLGEQSPAFLFPVNLHRDAFVKHDCVRSSLYVHIPGTGKRWLSGSGITQIREGARQLAGIGKKWEKEVCVSGCPKDHTDLQTNALLFTI